MYVSEYKRRAIQCRTILPTSPSLTVIHTHILRVRQRSMRTKTPGVELSTIRGLQCIRHGNRSEKSSKGSQDGLIFSRTLGSTGCHRISLSIRRCSETTTNYRNVTWKQRSITCCLWPLTHNSCGIVTSLCGGIWHETCTWTSRVLPMRRLKSRILLSIRTSIQTDIRRGKTLYGQVSSTSERHLTINRTSPFLISYRSISFQPSTGWMLMPPILQHTRGYVERNWRMVRHSEIRLRATECSISTGHSTSKDSIITFLSLRKPTSVSTVQSLVCSRRSQWRRRKRRRKRRKRRRNRTIRRRNCRRISGALNRR